MKRGIIGEPFNPSRELCGFYPPDIVGRNTELKLTDGQKRLYEWLVCRAGQNAEEWYPFKKIAEALGKCVRQVKHDAAVLEEKGLIAHVYHHRHPNRYCFLWHSIFMVQRTALKEDDPRVQDSTPIVQGSTKMRPSRMQPAALQSINRLNLIKESSSKASAHVQEQATEETTDDDSHLKLFQSHPPHPEAFEKLVVEFQRMLRLSKAQTLGVPLEQVDAPDRTITVQILEVFADFADAQKWVEGTIRRALARKSRSAMWGLWLKDAQNHKEQIRLDREAQEKGVPPRPPQSESKAENAQRLAEARFLRRKR